MLWFILILCACAAPAFARHDHFIVGGEDVPFAGKWPYQGSLEAFNSHTCGCSVFSSYWVLTAAHCLGYGSNAYSVVLGLHDRTDHSQGDPETYDLSYYIIHEDYDPNASGYPNDIAVLALFSPVNPADNDYIEFAILAPDDDYTYVGDFCHITGWGLTSGGGSLADVLQEAEIDVLSHSDCVFYWGSSINNGHICMLDYNGVVGACNGDSGGPMSCQRNGVTYVVGVASWVAAGCLPQWPSVYTRVSYFRDWISDNTGV